MSIFKRTDKSAKLSDQAGRLVSAAEIAAVSMYVPLSERFPAIRQFAPDEWDFFACIAGVFFGILYLNEVPDPVPLRAMIRVALDQKDRQAADALADCSAFVKRASQRMKAGDDPDLIVADAVGMWVLWNLLRRAPGYEETAPARAIGGMLQTGFAGWWKS